MIFSSGYSREEFLLFCTRDNCFSSQLLTFFYTMTNAITWTTTEPYSGKSIHLLCGLMKSFGQQDREARPTLKPTCFWGIERGQKNPPGGKKKRGGLELNQGAFQACTVPMRNDVLYFLEKKSHQRDQ